MTLDSVPGQRDLLIEEEMKESYLTYAMSVLVSCISSHSFDHPITRSKHHQRPSHAYPNGVAISGSRVNPWSFPAFSA